MASPGTKGPPNIHRLIFFSPSIVFTLRPRATAPLPLLITSNRLHAPLPSLTVFANGLAHASPVRVWRPDLNPPSLSSPSPRSNLDPPCPHCHHRSSSSSSPALSLAPHARAGLASSTRRCPRIVTPPVPSPSQPAGALELVLCPRWLALSACVPRPGRLHARMRSSSSIVSCS
jgi:hypothetical protein